MTGREAYEADCRRVPTYHDGTPRRAWDDLCAIARLSWERNPTVPAFVDVSHVTEYGLTQRLSAAGRVF